MLIIKANVTVFDGFRYLSWVEDIERIDVFKSKNESLTKEEILEKVKDKYRGTPIRFNHLVSIEKSNQDFDNYYFANMGEIK
ncbi:hypothetical protein [uncultured Clostridium sp.]|uniref:hypothetical protein n=1 Tax=uncultured Clostridium sp. TaxID=59620 RepID=UPI002624EBB7|nr:hypothetical protein [uncultured Clostridium sp.]